MSGEMAVRQGIPLTLRLSKGERNPFFNGLLPLGDEVRARFNEEAFAAYIESAKGRPFDVLEGMKVIIKEWLERLQLLDARLREVALFCSELVAEALDSAAVVKVDNPSDVSPIDLCSWSIYDQTYCQIKGARKEIPRYNDRTPGST